ncbi:HV146 protein, partial [Amia calva]|nr:HV146 protein [Amia calva]
FLFSGVRTDIVLTQPGSEIRKPGDTVKLSCQVSGFTLSSSWYISWIQQTPGKGLEWLAYIRGDNQYPSYAQSIQGRSLVSTDSSSNAYLELKTLKAEDTAVYYCARQSQ